MTAPIVQMQGWPVVEARIEGRPARILMDTGASSIVVSAALLGLRDRAWHTLAELCIGELCIDEATVWAEDNQLVTATPGDLQVHGLIGMSLLRYGVLELDHGRTIRFGFRDEVCAGTAIPVSFDDSGRPLAAAAIDGAGLGPVLLDSGALYTVLADQTVDRLAPYLRDSAMPTTACDVSGCNQSASLGLLREVCVGTQCEQMVDVKFPVWDAIGNSFLTRGRYAFHPHASELVRCAD